MVVKTNKGIWNLLSCKVINSKVNSYFYFLFLAAAFCFLQWSINLLFIRRITSLSIVSLPKEDLFSVTMLFPAEFILSAKDCEIKAPSWNFVALHIVSKWPKRLSLSLSFFASVNKTFISRSFKSYSCMSYHSDSCHLHSQYFLGHRRIFSMTPYQSIQLCPESIVF